MAGGRPLGSKDKKSRKHYEGKVGSGNYLRTEEHKKKLSWSMSRRHKQSLKLRGKRVSSHSKPPNWNKGLKLGSNSEHYGQYGSAVKKAFARIEAEIPELEKQGFRCIPMTDVLPDIIAIKDGKVYAIEVEYGNPNYSKYTELVKSRYDDVIWILRKFNKLIK